MLPAPGKNHNAAGGRLRKDYREHLGREISTLLQGALRVPPGITAWGNEVFRRDPGAQAGGTEPRQEAPGRRASQEVPGTPGRRKNPSHGK